MRVEGSAGLRLQADERVFDGAAVREQHRRWILNLLWRERETSRAELARYTGLARSTVSTIIGELLETGLVREARAGESTGGRPPIMLEFRDDAAYLVGVELGATHIGAVATDLRGRVVASREFPCAVRTQPAAALALVQRAVNEVVEESGADRSRVVGIGVGVPSPVSLDAPGRLLPSIVPHWEGYDVREAVMEACGLPVVVDNDANLGALAELWWGRTRGAGNLVYLKVATGIGAGLILDGRIYRGTTGIAGEVGHMSIDPAGPKCVCGLRGCLTTLVGTQRLLERVSELASEYPGSAVGPNTMTIHDLVDAALAGDALAERVVSEAGHTLGIGVANVLNLLNPDRVVIGGGITRAGARLLDPLRETVRTRALADSITHAEIELSPLGERAVALGAATLVLEAALADPTLFERRR